jgi:hypothetical protein
MNAKQTDILIIGGGSAGVAAAIGAARQGLKVIMVEKNEYAGGKATAAEVGTICGLYHYQPGQQAGYLVAGFAYDFAETLRKLSGSEPLQNACGLQYLPYQVDAFKMLCEQLLHDHSVEVLFGAELVQVKMKGNELEAADFNYQDKQLRIHASAFVDCTGHSQVSQLARLPLITSEQYQAAAQVFTITGIRSTLLTEQSLGLILAKALRTGVINGKLDAAFERLYIVPGSLRHQTVSLKLGLPIAVTYCRDNLQQLANCAKQMVEKLSAYLCSELDIFENARLHHIAPEPGIRVGYRSMGKYILAEADVLEARKFDNAIANCSWPVEEWMLDKRVKMNYLPTGDYYQVPAGCLISNSANNLFFAGRNISASDAAIASARVMGACLQTGYAAGALAAAQVQQLPMHEAIAALQQEQLSSTVAYQFEEVVASEWRNAAGLVRANGLQLCEGGPFLTLIFLLVQLVFF